MRQSARCFSAYVSSRRFATCRAFSWASAERLRASATEALTPNYAKRKAKANEAKTMTTQRPNILLITSDQQRADCNGFENPNIRTPHIDRLAREGTRFAACVTPNLVCQPSRASILTGQLPLTHGAWDNGVDLDPKVGERGFAGTLHRAGYETAFLGKAHFSTKSTFEATG